MATFTLTPVGDPDPETGVQQYSIAVTFYAEGNPVFVQDVISDKTGQDLTDHFQAYSDDYESSWKAANNME